MAQDVPDPAARRDGLTLMVYQASGPIERLPVLIKGQTPNVSKYVSGFDLQNDDFEIKDKFFAIASGFLRVDVAGEYTFELASDDGSELRIGERVVINHDGLHGADLAKSGSINLPLGISLISVQMFDNSGSSEIRLRWKTPGSTGFTPIPSSQIFSQADLTHVVSPGPKKFVPVLRNTRPGDGEPLTSVHPSFTLEELHNDQFQPRVGGMDFLPDGRLAICRWEPDGGVDIVDLSVRPVRVQRFAKGLQEPLGLKVVDGNIFVLEKQQLTQLIDSDNDGTCDHYRNVCSGWNVSSNFHEFAFGLVYVDGFFYANLAIAIDPGGKTTNPQVVGRGQTIKIDPKSGTFEAVAVGLRTPNGIGVGENNSIWITDNQGDWLPSSKLIRLIPGAFYGAHMTPDHEWASKPVTPPVAWLPQGEIGNSPSEPTVLKVGPWKGQILHGDVTHGGLKRTFVEQINGVDNGCVFRFTQGLAAGVNRVAWSDDGSLYVGGIGSTGNWQQANKKWFGLEKLSFNNGEVFEPLAVRLLSNGIEISFTDAVDSSLAAEPTRYQLEQFRYEPTSQYGGPKLDQKPLEVRSATVSADSKSVFLEVSGIQAGHVLYLRIADAIRSTSGMPLWTTEAWYTVNAVPTTTVGVVDEARAHNTLTESEKAVGWELLFDGKTTKGWRGFKRDTLPDRWTVIDGELVFDPKKQGQGGDIISTRTFGDFEMTLEWNIVAGGNSGIFPRATEAADSIWKSAPEMQVLDNKLHADGRRALTSAGSCYDLIEPIRDTSLGSDRWNLVRIVARGTQHEYWLNNEKIVEFDTASDAWKELIGKSKFAGVLEFAKSPRGAIGLQDHGDRVRFRNIKIREIDP